MDEINRLLESLKATPNFQALTAEKQEVIARLAHEFYDNDFALHLTPEELTAKLQIGSKSLWFDFLNMEPVRQYIQAQMAFNAQIASRKAFGELVKTGMTGDTGAIKQINEISGILNTGDKNKVVVMHQINRPKVVRKVDGG